MRFVTLTGAEKAVEPVVVEVNIQAVTVFLVQLSLSPSWISAEANRPQCRIISISGFAHALGYRPHTQCIFRAGWSNSVPAFPNNQEPMLSGSRITGIRS